jgi:rRNA biogenesis protein RRP5
MDRLAEDRSSSSLKGESVNGDNPVDEDKDINAIPTLEEMFHPGQYLRAVITAVHPQGVTMPAPSNSSENAISLGKPKNELDKASRRIELSIMPHELNQEIKTKDLVKGFVSVDPFSIVACLHWSSLFTN